MSPHARLAAVALIACAWLTSVHTARADDWVDHAALPYRIANNAVAAHEFDGTTYIYSFMGIDETRVFSGVQLTASRLNLTTGLWELLPDVPGTDGRIAALAYGFGDKVYLFGGYSVSAGGAEVSFAAVDIYDPATNTWSSGTPMPVPVDDMVGGVWNDQFIYLVSGWSNTGNVRNVQVYDPVDDSWDQAPLVPFGGTFGGAGGVVGDWILFADGVTNSFQLRNAVYLGEINPADPLDITWVSLGPHAGPAGYRMASGVYDGRMFFGGGTDNAYNYDGIGYDGNPSEPLPDMWEYRVGALFSSLRVNWLDRPVPAMDHRGFAVAGGRLYVVGGMEAGQSVTDRVSSYRPGALVAVPAAAESVALELEGTPNPARTTVRFSAVLEAPSGVLRDAAIYDASGRRIRSLAEVELMNGFTWDLADEGGRRVAPGVYWIHGRVFDRNLRSRIVVTD